LGTTFYSIFESWSYVDAFYFSAMTLTTIGYGDFFPSSTLTKLFTIGYAFFGIGLMFYIVGTAIKEIIFTQERTILRHMSNFRKKKKR
jgi:voltage-gated potassium channel